MEKLVYVLWKREQDSNEDFAETLRGEVAKRFLELGTERISMNLADAHVKYAEKSRMTRLDPPPSGTISFWLDLADDRASYQAELERVTSRLAGYLVVESVPLRNTTRPAPLGERVPGTNVVALIEKPDWIDYDAWLAHWHGHHRVVALETQSTYLYIRNVVVRPLTQDAPPWKGIVEEGFPTEAVGDPMLWYDAGGSKEKMQENLGRMIESCKAFLDLDRVESHPMSEYRIKE